MAPLQPLTAAPAAQPRSRLGHGVTFEANLGVGRLRIAAKNGGTSTENALGGLDLGLGGWIAPRLALTLRLAGATHTEDVGSYTGAFLGASLQYWLNDNAWLGAGGGISTLTVDLVNQSDPDPKSGFGLDLRAGYSVFDSGQHSVNLSFEVTPGFYKDRSATGFALLLGYQYL